MAKSDAIVPQMGLRYPIIHINGFPGTGKLTIAKILVTLLRKELNVESQLIHNHLLIDLAAAVLDRTDEGYQDFRKQTRDLIFQTLEQNTATYQRIHIFTDFQSGDPLGSMVCAEYAAMADRRGALLIPIIINCDEAENLRRVASDERSRYNKLVDAKLVKMFRENEAGVHRFRDNTLSLEVDVTHTSAEDAAKLIKDHVLRVFPQLFSRDKQ
jgi:hypothetical protein